MIPVISYNFDDKCHQVYFFMNDNGSFIILNEEKKIIKDFFPPRMGMETKCQEIYKEYTKCKNFTEINKRKLFFYQKKMKG